LKLTPKIVRYYLLFAFVLIATPTILSLYKGHTGKFLVATGMVDGSVFEETVMYVTVHNGYGAHAIIINKPLREDQFHIFNPEGSPQDIPEYDLMYGGPVHFEYGSHTFFIPDNNAINGFRNSDGSEFEFFSEVDKRLPTSHKKLYYGFAGWAPFQLNVEILKGVWGVIDYDPELLLNTPPEQIWNKAIKKVLADRPMDIGGI
jgi:putative transcriptional regulator